MAALSVVDIARTGVDVAGAAVAASDTFTNTGAEFIEVKNGSGGSINVTITTTQTGIDSAAVADTVVAIADGVTKAIGPFPRYAFSSTVTVVCSATTSVTIKVLRLTPAAA